MQQSCPLKPNFQHQTSSQPCRRWIVAELGCRSRGDFCPVALMTSLLHTVTAEVIERSPARLLEMCTFRIQTFLFVGAVHQPLFFWWMFVCSLMQSFYSLTQSTFDSVALCLGPGRYHEGLMEAQTGLAHWSAQRSNILIHYLFDSYPNRSCGCRWSLPNGHHADWCRGAKRTEYFGVHLCGSTRQRPAGSCSEGPETRPFVLLSWGPICWCGSASACFFHIVEDKNVAEEFVIPGAEQFPFSSR